MSLKTNIEREGQEFVYQPVFAHPTCTAHSVALAFGNRPKPILIGHERIKLNWKKPIFDADGQVVALVPRKAES